MSLQQLAQVPENVRHAATVVAALDQCFLLGFSRLGPDQHEALDAVGRICGGSPLGATVAGAVAALKRNEFVVAHFTALAVARAAIQGAMHDALRAQARAALGRTTDEEPGVEAKSADVPALRNWQESTRQWLMELALAGFQQLESPTLAPFAATLEQIQGEPKLTRLGALLTGFLNELLSSLPIASLPSVPLYRWVDLWTRGMVGSLHVPEMTGSKVNGKLTPLAADLRHHGFFVSADIYGLLESTGKARAVRVTLSSYKVDVLAGREVWRCFGKPSESLLQGLSEGRTLDVKDATLTDTGGLLWDGKASLGKPFKRPDILRRFAPAADGVSGFPSVAPVDRHPVQIAEPVFLDKTDELPIATQRLSRAGGLDANRVKGATSLFGLLRFDGGVWAVQPLSVTVGSQEYFAGQDAYEAATEVDRKKGDTLAILRERASRLLRKKS